MYKILLATDGSPSAAKAVEETAKIAAPLNAEVTVLSVISHAVDVSDYISLNLDEELKQFANDYRKAIEVKCNEIVDNAVKPLKEKGIKVNAKVVPGDPAATIARIAEEENYDLIIMGNRGLNKAQELFLGSVSNKVAHLAKTSVLIVK
ncbi:MAG TPA: universal stress protein [Clostridia bacterium]|nr:universal stress protein [Clostridia bacterium]